MARSQIQRRQEAERERKATFDATLRRAVRQHRLAPDFHRALGDAVRGLAELAVRDPAAWRPHLKTRDEGRLRLAAARHLFAVYPVSSALEGVWIDDAGLGADEVHLRRRWYAVAARGGSLHKEAGANDWLTRKEVHAFLDPPAGLNFGEAQWHAVAGSYTDDTAVALRIARSKINRTPRIDMAFWRAAARFFCANPAPVETIDELCDYLADARRRDPTYALDGRTLNSLTRRMHAWYHDIAAIERIEAIRLRARRRGVPGLAADKSWSGRALDDWEWTPSGRDAMADGTRYVMRQLTRAEDLVMESRAMCHCVSSYAPKCIAGLASIWSLRRCTQDRIERLLTIEVDAQGEAIQVRGVCNRPARAGEQQVLERWAQARGISLGRVFAPVAGWR